MKKRRDVRTLRVKVSISPNDERRIEALAKAEGKGFSSLMYELLKAELDRREPPGGK